MQIRGGGILTCHVGVGVHLGWIILTHNWAARSSGPEPIGLFEWNSHGIYAWLEKSEMFQLFQPKDSMKHAWWMFLII